MAYTKLHRQDETEDCDNIWWETASISQNGNPRYLIYFVPGNPCLVPFYRPFLYELFKLLSDVDGPGTNVAVAASSLPGFEIHPNGLQYSPSGLNQQIENVEKLITHCVQRYRDTGDETEASSLKVVLVAHSVGAYMVLEALRRRAEALNDLVDVHIAGAVLLFPTVTEISRSWHGSILKPFCSIPYFPALVSGLARGILYPISTQRLSWWLSRLGRMPAHTSDAAARFLKSPNGIYSALYLTVDEMAMIQGDTWNISIWGTPQDEHGERARTSGMAVPLCFYFGAQDVWVWNESRDRLIALRGRLKDDVKKLWKPLMIIDEKNIPHGFVVDHNKVVAEKAFELISQLAKIRDSRKLSVGDRHSEPAA